MNSLRIDRGKRVAIAFFLLLGAAAPRTHAASESAHDMTLVGQHDLGGRSAYQPVILRQGDRWIAYVGHHGGATVNPLTRRREGNGTSILDVTDVRAPRLLAHVPVASGGGAQMVRVCGGLSHAGNGFYMLRTRGHSAHEMWDVSAPEKPAFVTTVVDGLSGTHKNWWECDSGIAYLVSGAPGWRTSRMAQVYDLSAPRRPKHLRDFGLPGHLPGARGPAPTGLHGPISTGVAGNRVYFGYGVNHGGVMQIVDRAKLLSGAREPTRQNVVAPQVGRFDLPADYGAHTALPVGAMDTPRGRRAFVFVVNEAIAYGCSETMQKVWAIDVTDESRPVVAAQFEVPDTGYCARGVRFGAHASNEYQPAVFAKRVLFFSWFAAGVRALDIRDPYHPREIAHYVPAGGALTNNVEVDDRGYIYIVDRGGLGMHILELAGAARAAMALPRN